MNTDIRSEILKQLDIEDLSALCLTDENFYLICNNKNFWYQYFVEKWPAFKERC